MLRPSTSPATISANNCRLNSKFGFHPPDTSTPGRPGYGGTCYSDILSTSITQYDNSSSSGVMFFSTSGQAYAHPIDGFALETGSTVSLIVSFVPFTASY